MTYLSAIEMIFLAYYIFNGTASFCADKCIRLEDITTGHSCLLYINSNSGFEYEFYIILVVESRVYLRLLRVETVFRNIKLTICKFQMFIKDAAVEQIAVVLLTFFPIQTIGVHFFFFKEDGGFMYYYYLFFIIVLYTGVCNVKQLT